MIAGAASHYADAELVTGNYFTSLGVSALAGRTLTPEDDRAGAAPVAVISYRYWERHFGLNPEAVGRTIFVNGHPVTLIGIAPHAFAGVCAGALSGCFLSNNARLTVWAASGIAWKMTVTLGCK